MSSPAPLLSSLFALALAAPAPQGRFRNGRKFHNKLSKQKWECVVFANDLLRFGTKDATLSD